MLKYDKYTGYPYTRIICDYSNLRFLIQEKTSNL